MNPVLDGIVGVGLSINMFEVKPGTNSVCFFGLVLCYVFFLFSQSHVSYT